MYILLVTDGQVLAVSSHKNNQSKPKEVEATKKADKAVSFVVQKKIQATIKMEPEILQQQQSVSGIFCLKCNWYIYN